MSPFLVSPPVVAAMQFSEPNSSGGFAFYTGTGINNVMQITNGGYVGIGTTSPTRPLEVSSNTLGYSALFYGNNGGGAALALGGLNGTGQMQAYSSDSMGTAANLFLEPTGGNVGIGMSTAPSEMLSLNNGFIKTDGSAAYGLKLYRSGASVGSVTSANNMVSLQSGGNGVGLLSSGGTQEVTMLDNGNFGIGAVSPSYKLDVGGFINTDMYSGYKQNGSTVLYASSTLYETALGYTALQNNTGSGNTALGNSALKNNTSGADNTAIGTNAAPSNTTGNSNDVIGYQALDLNTSGSNNNVMGVNAMEYNTSATGDIAIGGSAATGNSSYTNQDSTVIGTSAGYNFTANSNYNTLLGYQTGYDIQNGTNNLILGTEQTTGTGITSGSNNILLGQGVCAGLSQTGSNQLNIGNLIFGTGLGSGSAISNGNVGINNSSPNYDLDVGGFINTDMYSGYKQNGLTILTSSSTLLSTLVGYNAGPNLTLTGVADTLVGNTAGTSLTTGQQNTALGYDTLGVATASS